MNKYWLIGAVAILAIAGGWWYVSQSNAPVTSDTTQSAAQQIPTTGSNASVTQPSTTTETDLNDTVVTSGMEFDPAKVQPGDKFGAFTVTYSSSWPNDNSYSVKFKGPVTIQGKLTDTDPGMCDAMLEVTPSTSETLPRVIGTKVEGAKFYLNMEGLPDTEQVTYSGGGLTTSSGVVLQEGDTLEVTVDTLSKSYQGKDCSGNKIDVTSLKKISS